MPEVQETRARKICNSSRFVGAIWRGKTMDQLTDQECEDMLKYIYEMTGTSFYTRY